MKEFKEAQKKLAEKIKKDGSDYDSYGFRHNHIAYCELRGTLREKIEIPRKYNDPSENTISSIKGIWLRKLDAWRTEYEKTLGTD